ncbi:MAG: FecR domain-containing protein, partial [Flammeovirgaceae bacterium]
MIAKFFAGEATPDEAIAISEWRELSADNDKTFLHLEQLWYRRKMDWHQRKKYSKEFVFAHTKIEKTIIFTPPRMAAAFFAFIVLVTLLSQFVFKATEKTKMLSTQENPFHQVLPDGSSVVINHNSTFSYPEEFKENKRSVTLSGEAYFEVKHDKNK